MPSFGRRFGGRLFGYCKYVPLPNANINIKEEIMLCFAGDVAEEIICDQQGWTHRGWRNGWYGDDAMTADYLLAKRIVPQRQPRDELLQELHHRTEELLSVPIHWSAVESVATALLERMQIHGLQVHEIIQIAISDAIDEEPE
jgi:hypothetical protein